MWCEVRITSCFVLATARNINKLNLITNSIKQIPYAFIVLLVSATVVSAVSFTVPVSKHSASPVAIVDEDGTSFSNTNPMPTSGGVVTSTVTDGALDVVASGTPEPIVGASTPFITCTIPARQGNTDVIVLGGATVDATEATRTGLPLVPFQSATKRNGDLADYYVDVEVSGEGLTWQCDS